MLEILKNYHVDEYILNKFDDDSKKVGLIIPTHNFNDFQELQWFEEAIYNASHISVLDFSITPKNVFIIYTE